MKKKFALISILIILLYLLVSLPGWQSLPLLSQQSMIDWSLVLHPVILHQISLFIFAHGLILLSIIILCFSTAYAVAHYSPQLFIPVALGIFFLLLYAIIGYSVTHFPWLEIALISDSLSQESTYKTIGTIALWVLVISTLVALHLNIHTSKTISIFQSAAALFLLHPLFLDSSTNVGAAQAESTESGRSQPDIIIIGLDSVSLHQAREHSPYMPFVNSLLTSGYNYTQAFTPLGRTYAAWHSILSGRYPATSGVRFNLTEFKPEQIADMLPADLKKLGYFNLYAQDERRFNNINEEYGFDSTIGPTVGAIDFVIPLFADHPFSSYFLNSTLGEWLFPSLHNNRASSVTYQPNTFVQSILRKTGTVSNHQPLFMAGHFCLAHFPYRWRSYRPSKDLPSELVLYRDSLKALDKQIEAMFTGLKAQGRLDNAIVVLLSDHGEGLGAELPLWTGDDRTPADQFGQMLRGHGNSLLSRDQNNVIINIRHTTTLHSSIQIDTPVSLVDIRPTILTLLKQPPPQRVDGTAIPPATSKAVTNRYLFMETGIMMDLPQPDATAAELSKKVSGIADGYTINPAGRLVISEELIQLSIPKKQFGVVYNEELMISSSNNPDEYLWINRTDNSWIQMESREFSNSKYSHLLNALNCYRKYKDCQAAPN